VLGTVDYLRRGCVALVVGVLVATTVFTVLTAASRTAQLRTVGGIDVAKVRADIRVDGELARRHLELSHLPMIPRPSRPPDDGS
jgi:hypothetical protein